MYVFCRVLPSVVWPRWTRTEWRADEEPIADKLLTARIRVRSSGRHGSKSRVKIKSNQNSFLKVQVIWSDDWFSACMRTLSCAEMKAWCGSWAALIHFSTRQININQHPKRSRIPSSKSCGLWNTNPKNRMPWSDLPVLTRAVPGRPSRGNPSAYDTSWYILWSSPFCPRGYHRVRFPTTFLLQKLNYSSPHLCQPNFNAAQQCAIALLSP